MTKLVKSDKFFAFEYRSCLKTTEGQPNSRTGNLSYAGRAVAFTTKKERQTWVEERTIFDYISCGRTSTTIPQLRQLCLGLTVDEFNDYVLSIEDEK